MNKSKISVIVGALLLGAFSCADPDLGPVLTFDIAGKGAYIRLIEEGDRGINLFDISGSTYTYSVEFVDLEKGGLVSEYNLDLTYTDADPSNGDKSTGPIRLRSYSASDFEDLPSGFKGVTNITVTADDVIKAAGLTNSDISAGDRFRVDGSLVLNDGSVFSFDNSSAAVRGSAFLAHFRFDMIASCPTELAGTYDINVTATWCGDNSGTPSKQVTWTLLADGYEVDDFSFGAYDNCYGVGSTLPGGNLRIVDVCNKISITGASRWGEIYTWSNLAVNGEVLSFDWVNDYGEGGSAEVIKPGGWPPLELK